MEIQGFTMFAGDRQELESRMQRLREALIQASPDDSFDRLLELRRDSDRLTDAMRRHLFASRLVADDSDDSAVRWICTQHHRMTRIAKRIAESIARRRGPADDRCLGACAIALHHAAESAKGEVVAGFMDSQHHVRLHALMRLGMAGGRHREPISMPMDGAQVKCTLEALYLRALLLSRVSTGGLTPRQIEIFDAYFLHRIDVLRGTDTPPQDSTWRADVDGTTGLRSGARNDRGVSIYLPLQPIEEAYRAIVAEFHAGRVFPPTGAASRFEVEDHVAVLDLMRRTLRRSRRDPVGRAKRHAANALVEVHAGLAAILAEGFNRGRRAVRSTLATVDGPRAGSPHRRSGYDSAVDTIYEAARTKLHLVNISHTGLGLEGSEPDCGGLAAGDLIGVHLHDGEPLVLAKAVRRVATPEGRITIGAQRISSAARVVTCTAEDGDRRPAAVVYVPGNEAGGNRDVFIAPESLAADRRVFSTRAGGQTFRFQFNRVRERGRGWVLAGFRILAAEKAA